MAEIAPQAALTGNMYSEMQMTRATGTSIDSGRRIT
jgi:hypothetical protein